jgi:DNA polymerase III epsilon subunit-like protein
VGWVSFTIYFDLETNGLEAHHVPIQLAAIAIDDATGAELSSFERKLKFNARESSLEALQVNHYDPAVWAREAKEPATVVVEFSEWAKPYACIEMTSKAKGTKYKVGKLAGHNVVAFDLVRLRGLYGTRFFPFSYHTKDTLQRAVWFFDEHPEVKRPESLKLAVLCESFGLPVNGAHDALADVRMSAALARAIAKAERNGR